MVDDSFTGIEVDKKEEKLVHYDFIAAFPGIELEISESDYENIIDPTPAIHSNRPTVQQRVSITHMCTDHDVRVTIMPSGSVDDNCHGCY